MHYLDTSVLVAILTNEENAAAIQDWLSQSVEPLAASHWTATEFSSALSLKQRTGQIDAEQAAIALTAFRRLAAETFVICDVSRDHFYTAAQWTRSHALGLRSADALHLAIAASHSATVCTLDRRLAAAGPQLGVPTQLVG